MAALQKNGISADPHLIKVGDYVSDKAYKAACDLLEMREQDRPTAIFAFNDLAQSMSIAPPDSTASVCPNSYRSSVSMMSILRQACVRL